MIVNEKAVERLKATEKRYQIMDEKLEGFGIRVDADGRKSYFWTRRINYKLRFKFLGDCDGVSVKDARDAAKTLNDTATSWKTAGYQDPDPFEKQSIIERTTVPTFREMVQAYIERHVKLTANKPERATYEVNWQVKRHFEGWLDRRIDQIKLEDMLAVKNRCGKKHHLANRAVEFIKALFNWSAKNREGKINFWPVENPAKDVEFYEEKPRTRFLQPEEMIRFEETLAKETHQDLADFLVLSMATGARKSDVFGMRWSDIQWERTTWCIPDSTKQEPYDSSLEPVALAVLERRRKTLPDSALYVFPSFGKTGHLTDLKKPWKRFRKRASIPDVHTHDLRRTVASYQAIAGESLQKIAATLGHKSIQSTIVYAKLQDQAVRDSKATGKAKMLEMMKDAKKRQAGAGKQQKRIGA